MAFGGFNKQANSTPMVEINMVPLIDVMLVLLVIFIVTAPLLTHAVKVDLPKVSSSPNITKPEHVQLGIMASGEVFWNGEAISSAELGARFAATAKGDPQTEVQIRAERTTHYEKVAWVMAEAARTGLTRIGFVTEPNAK